jgi:hypothetical protein
VVLIGVEGASVAGGSGAEVVGTSGAHELLLPSLDSLELELESLSAGAAETNKAAVHSIAIVIHQNRENIVLKHNKFLHYYILVVYRT